MIKEAIRRTEAAFENSGYWIHDHPKRVIMMMLLIVVFLASQLPSIQFDTSTESFFEKDDPTLLEYDAFREQFGRDEIVLALIHPKDVFEITFLEKLKAFHEELEETVPHLDEVRSLVNVTSMRGEEGELIIEELMEDWPETEEEIAQLRKRVLDNKFYRNFLVSEDGLYTAVMIRSNAFAESIQEEALDAMLEGGFEEEEQPSGTSASESLEEPLQRLSEEQNTEFVGAIKQVAANHRTLDFPIDLGGSPVMVSDLKQKMIEEMPKFVISSILMIAFLLSLLFRRISGVILPLLTVVLSLFSTIGLFSMTGTKLTIISQILPSFLLAVGVGYSVHLLVIFYRHLRDQGNKREAIGYALGHSGLAILITSLTTAGGLLSFSPVKVAPVSDLGIFGAAGVLICVSFTLILLPALLALIPFSSDSKKKTPNQKNPADRILKSCGDFAVSRPWFVISVSLGIALISSIGAAQLRFSHDPIKWLPDGHSLRSANQAINDHMKGSANLELVVRREGENAVKDPEFMNRLEEFNQFAETQTYKDILIGKSSSIVDTVKEINQVLNEDQEEYYRVPQDRELIAQELLLFENGGTDDLENLVDTPFSQSRITLKSTWVDANQFVGLLEQLEPKVDQLFGGEISFTLTGLIPMMVKTITFVMEGMMISYLIAGFVITLLMIVLLASLKLGLWSMIPNFLPILVGLGVMGMLGLPLDAMSILVGSIAIGLAVDDTVHFMHNFRRYHLIHGDVRLAVEKTLTSTGRALLLTTIVLSSGFFIFTISTMNNLISFGLITGLTIIVALLGDILLAPAMMTLIYRNHKSKLETT